MNQIIVILPQINTFAILFMEHLKSKSEINLSAAELLHEHSHYPSVIHCAYYSCIQLMKHAWLNTMGKTEEDLRGLNSRTREGSHEVLINQMKIFIKSRSREDRDFNRTILELKRLRVDADYLEVSIDSTKSDQSIHLSKSLLNILKKCL